MIWHRRGKSNSVFIRTPKVRGSNTSTLRSDCISWIDRLAVSPDPPAKLTPLSGEPSVNRFHARRPGPWRIFGRIGFTVPPDRQTAVTGRDGNDKSELARCRGLLLPARRGITAAAADIARLGRRIGNIPPTRDHLGVAPREPCPQL